MPLRSVSVLIPTLNCAQTLELCLSSVAAQEYPRELIEIIIADGGSTDSTLDVARRYTDKIYANPLKTGEAGKAVALKQASSELIALIDSDNILPSPDWFTRMTAPFDDPDIVAAEPIEYTCRPTDPATTRYFALLGMNDPLCLFLGNYDRYSCVTGRWTEMPVESQVDAGSYLKVAFRPENMPTIGANGFVARREAVVNLGIGDYYFDIDVASQLSADRYFAKVKTGIVHLFASDLSVFARKQRRRMRDFQYYRSAGVRSYAWTDPRRTRGVLKFVLTSLLVFPLVAQAVAGYRRRPDLRAWLYHPAACWVTLVVYVTEFLAGPVRKQAIHERAGWGQ